MEPFEHAKYRFSYIGQMRPTDVLIFIVYVENRENIN